MQWIKIDLPISVSTAICVFKIVQTKFWLKPTNFPAVHIDYSKGKKFCKFDCHKCGEVCPKCAIIKQDGKAPILNAQKCIGCGACKKTCWHDAIQIFSVKEQKII